MKGTLKIKTRLSVGRLYSFHTDLVCRQFMLDDFVYVVHDRNIRCAWRKLLSQVQDYIHFMGFTTVFVERIRFRSCDIYNINGSVIKSVTKIN